MTITATLTAKSLQSAANQLRKYAQSLDKKSEKLVRQLGEFGADNAINELGHIDSGDTINSIHYIHEGKSGTITAGGASVWIEFGTGVIANKGNSQHPKKDEIGVFGWGEYGYGFGKDYWWFINRKGEKKRTAGIPMNPFMYNTSQEMRRELIDIAKDVFSVD